MFLNKNQGVCLMNHFLYKVKHFGNFFLLSLKIPFKIDVHIVEHCNLNCKGCSHFSSVAQPEFLNPKEYEKALLHLSRIEKSIGQIQLIGGEPLLHSQLPLLIRLTRSYLPQTKINILSNGILFVNEEELRKKEDFIDACRTNDVLIKITKYPGINYDAVEDNLRKADIKFYFFADKGLSNSWGKFPLYKDGFKHISNHLKFLKLTRCDSFNCLQLVGTKIYPCCHAAYIRHLNNYFNLNFELKKEDAVDITKIKRSFPIRKLLFMSTPFCKYCGNGYKKSKWAKSEKNMEEWMAD